MANTGSTNSGGSQFFLNVASNTFLDWFSPGASKHPVFGRVTSGMEIATAISQVKTSQDNPVDPIMMKSITITGLPGGAGEEGPPKKRGRRGNGWFRNQKRGQVEGAADLRL